MNSIMLTESIFMLKKIVKVIANVSVLKVLVILAAAVWLVIQYQTFQIDFLRLKIEAQDIQLKKVGLLLQADCFKDEDRTGKCKTLFEQFGIALPKTK